MAENKKSFVLYADYTELFNELSDAEAGQLIKHIFDYVNDKNPVCDNKIINASFIPIKLQLKRDLVKWEETRGKRSEAGKISAERRQQKSTLLTHVDFVQQTSTNPTVTVNVTDNVTVNDTVIDNKKPLTINIGNRTFTGTTSEWLMLNKEQAVEVFLMNDYPNLNRDAVFKKVDTSTVNYQFKDDNHPFNYFKSICMDFDKPKKKQQFNKPETPKYKILKDD